MLTPVDVAFTLCHPNSSVVWGQQSPTSASVVLPGLRRTGSQTADLHLVQNKRVFWLLEGWGDDTGLSCGSVPAFIWASQILNHLGAWLTPLRGNLFACHFLIC